MIGILIASGTSYNILDEDVSSFIILGMIVLFYIYIVTLWHTT